MNTYVIILRVQVPAGFSAEGLTAHLHGANINGYGDGAYLGQITKVVDAVEVK